MVHAPQSPIQTTEAVLFAKKPGVVMENIAHKNHQVFFLTAAGRSIPSHQMYNLVTQSHEYFGSLTHSLYTTAVHCLNQYHGSPDKQNRFTDTFSCRDSKKAMIHLQSITAATITPDFITAQGQLSREHSTGK